MGVSKQIPVRPADLPDPSCFTARANSLTCIYFHGRSVILAPVRVPCPCAIADGSGYQRGLVVVVTSRTDDFLRAAFELRSPNTAIPSPGECK